MKETAENPLHLKSVNHISLVCKSVEESIDFYQHVLGFFPIRRHGSFDFDGAWYFNFPFPHRSFVRSSYTIRSDLEQQNLCQKRFLKKQT
ncbi:hypothetical protein QN277_000787 [Acacia crassicarpa]|uniref:Glyoxalase/fosfomycin resistance/dioxygenase domain-containing protein n=1 Tax=Acacia crassicarpa TaxID=499986 RepID=A0AAE1N5S2_9FABA|nr:hypothetical protein QN277_000787 [Acacia crassicarpa]